jgi:hypothetical protein
MRIRLPEHKCNLKNNQKLIEWGMRFVSNRVCTETENRYNHLYYFFLPLDIPGANIVTRFRPCSLEL